MIFIIALLLTVVIITLEMFGLVSERFAVITLTILSTTVIVKDFML
jgi:hypothetical protein